MLKVWFKTERGLTESFFEHHHNNPYFCPRSARFMLGHLKSKIARKKYLRLQKEHRSKAITKLQKVGVIVDLDMFEKLSETQKLVQAFNTEGGMVEVIGFSNNAKKREAFEGLTFKINQLTLSGDFKTESDAEKFQQKPYDLLVNYFVEASPQLLLLSAAAEANLRVGFPSESNPINDLNIDVMPSEISRFAAEVKKYLPLINQ